MNDVTERRDLDWKKISESKKGFQRNEAIASEMMRVEYVCLTDCFINIDKGAREVLASLDLEAKNNGRYGEQRTYKLKCLRHEDGTDVKPGDKITWKQQHVTRLHGRPLRQKDKELMIRQGKGHLLVKMGEAVADADCCIVVPYVDAAQLLSLYGQTFEPDSYGKKYGISGKKEISSRPVTINGETVQRKYRWNWRFEEVPTWLETKKKRTRKANDESADNHKNS
jgi:hypothetical protein